MSETVTSTMAARNFADYLNRVAYRHESFLVTRGNRPVADIRPVPSGRRLADLPSLVASLPRLAPEEAEAFARDLEEGREALNRVEERDAWRS